MREIVTFCVGQAGAQVGDSIFTLLASESTLDFEGRTSTPTEVNDMLFEETYIGNYTPRVIFTDAEPAAVDSVILTSKIKRAYTEDFLITGQEDSQGCYARGKFATTKALLPTVCAQFRRALEQCEAISCIRLVSSVCGGTGSGFSTSLLILLDDIVCSIDKHLHSILPDPGIDTGTEICNAVLALGQTQPLHHIRLLYDNSSLSHRLSPIFPRSMSPTFSDLNNLVAMVHSHLSIDTKKTAGEMDVSHLSRNLICYPEIKMVAPALAPLLKRDSRLEMNAFGMTSELFQPNQEFCALDTSIGSYFTAWVLYRGDFNAWEIHQTKGQILNPRHELDIEFKAWIPHFMKIGLVTDKPQFAGEYIKSSEKSMLKISNHSNIVDVTDAILAQFEKILDSRAFVFWYSSFGQEDHELVEAAEVLTGINELIRSLAKDSTQE